MPLKNNWVSGETYDAAAINAVATQINTNADTAAAKYTKPGTGIPKTDLASAVQTSLNKADTALQAVPDNAVTNAKIADDAVGVAELSATGTPNATTFLRGDNTWATPAGGGSGPSYRPGTIMALGDSLAATVAAYDPARDACNHQHLPVDYLFFGNMLAGTPLELLGSAATAGFTLQQIINTHLPTILSVKPQFVVVYSGIGNNVLAGGEFTPSLLRQFETDVLTPIENYGGTPILASMVPAVNASNPGISHTEVERYNTWASRWARARGYPYMDFYSKLVDPATGTFKAGYTSDNLHFNGVGSAAIIPLVKDMIAGLPTQHTARFSLAAYNSTITGRSPNPLLAYSGDTPTGWTKYDPGDATSVVAPAPGGRPGNRMLLTQGPSNFIFQYAPELAVAGGNLWEWGCQLDFNGVGCLVLAWYKQDGSTVDMIIGSTDTPFPLVIPAGTIAYMSGKAPSGLTSYKPVVGTAVAANAQVGVSQWTMRNMTTLNI